MVVIIITTIIIMDKNMKWHSHPYCASAAAYDGKTLFNM